MYKIYFIQRYSLLTNNPKKSIKQAYLTIYNSIPDFDIFIDEIVDNIVKEGIMTFDELVNSDNILNIFNNYIYDYIIPLNTNDLKNFYIDNNLKDDISYIIKNIISDYLSEDGLNQLKSMNINVENFVNLLYNNKDKMIKLF